MKYFVLLQHPLIFYRYVFPYHKYITQQNITNIELFCCSDLFPIKLLWEKSVAIDFVMSLNDTYFENPRKWKRNSQFLCKRQRFHRCMLYIIPLNVIYKCYIINVTLQKFRFPWTFSGICHRKQNVNNAKY